MTLSIADLAKFYGQSKTNETSSSTNYYPFTKIAYDTQAIIRFLPDLDDTNPGGFLIESVVHDMNIGGQYRTVPCLYEMFGEPCPFCEQSQRFYKEDDRINGAKYWKKRRHIGQVIVIKDPLPVDPVTGENHEGKVRIVTLSTSLMNIIKKTLAKQELDELPFAFKGGYNFIIEKTAQGEYANYTLGSQFARKATDLTPEQIALAEQEMVELRTLLPSNPGREKMEQYVDMMLTGKTFNEVDSEENVSQTAFVKTTQKGVDDVSKPTSVRPQESKEEPPFEPDEPVATKPAVAVSEADDDESDEGEDILQKIRQRRKQREASAQEDAWTS